MLISKCCEAQLKIINNKGLYYVCTKCNKPCNIIASLPNRNYEKSSVKIEDYINLQEFIGL